jgi:Trk K+ transport system NAD-binding subunit
LKFNEDVVGIEIDPSTEFVRRVLDLNVPVVFGDATRPDILRDACTHRAVSIITCTENDLTNLEIALVARELKPDIRVVLRMFDDDMAPKIAGGFNISTAFSTSALSAPAFAAAATVGEIRDTIHVGEQVLSFSELTLRPGTRLVGWRIEDLERELDLSVIVHRRGERVDLHPRNDIPLQAGDQVFVLATLDVLGRLRRMNVPREGDAH